MPVDVTPGSSPLILAFPHASTDITKAILQRLNETGRDLTDTDWHVDFLYRDLVEDATYVRAKFHRYACDANRDPTGQSLYPGQYTTDLVPLTNFDGVEIWDEPPKKMEVSFFRSAYHTPYHAALAAQIARIRAKYGFAILYDCHSIRSQVPTLFEGTLPDFNIGTNMGSSCDPDMTAHVTQLCMANPKYTSIVNGRFKGGWTIRHHGRPATGVHAIQMELAQSTYLAEEADPWRYDDAKAEGIRQVLGNVLNCLQNWSPPDTARRESP